MALQTWYYIPGTVNGDCAGWGVFGGLAWMINSQNIANRTSELYVAIYMGRSGDPSGVYNLNTLNSYMEFDGGNRFNFNSRYDLRQCGTINYKYKTGVDSAVFPLGSVYIFTVTHDENGLRTVPLNTYLNGNNAPYLNSVTASTNAVLDAIPVGGKIKAFGSSFLAKPIKHWTGSIWSEKPLKHWNGSAWVKSKN